MATEILYLNEVAARLKRSRKAVEWLCYSGQLQSGKLAGRRVVRSDALDRFINAAFESPAAAPASA
ncbi:helix-turn-helix domain-containing protein [Agrococcus sp. DT81.2]|uniref:helix-turn-helix domain-containing protein n=1 Tax=Agrococcus sp. DT81.2 TaxID=3393414 RepID=UPI003CE524D6